MTNLVIAAIRTILLSKTSILTGASQGIGYELAKRLMVKGNKMLTTQLQRKKTGRKSQEIPHLKNNLNKRQRLQPNLKHTLN